MMEPGYIIRMKRAPQWPDVYVTAERTWGFDWSTERGDAIVFDARVEANGAIQEARLRRGQGFAAGSLVVEQL